MDTLQEYYLQTYVVYIHALGIQFKDVCGVLRYQKLFPLKVLRNKFSLHSSLLIIFQKKFLCWPKTMPKMGFYTGKMKT